MKVTAEDAGAFLMALARGGAGPATVRAATGATLLVGEYAPGGAVDEPVAVQGAVAFPQDRVVRMPATWTARTGTLRLFDLSEAAATALPASITLLDASGEPVAKPYKARVSAGAVNAEFILPATVMVMR